MNPLLTRRMLAPSLGRVETIAEKIRIDMPLPIPRAVISSPSHMIRAVPAVRVSTARANRPGVSPGKMSRGRIPWLWASCTMLADCSRARNTVT